MIIRKKEIAKMSNKERNDKVKDLRMELIKEKVSASKGGKIKAKEIRRTIARLLTFNRLNKEEEKSSKESKKVLKKSIK